MFYKHRQRDEWMSQSTTLTGGRGHTQRERRSLPPPPVWNQNWKLNETGVLLKWYSQQLPLLSTPWKIEWWHHDETGLFKTSCIHCVGGLKLCWLRRVCVLIFPSAWDAEWFSLSWFGTLIRKTQSALSTVNTFKSALDLIQTFFTLVHLLKYFL